MNRLLPNSAFTAALGFALLMVALFIVCGQFHFSP